MLRHFTRILIQPDISDMWRSIMGTNISTLSNLKAANGDHCSKQDRQIIIYIHITAYKLDGSFHLTTAINK